MKNHTENYEKVRQTILENHTWHAWEVAAYLGLETEMGDDEATDYVKRVRRTMRETGDLIMPPELPPYASPEDRLEDVLKLFELRKYNVKKKQLEPMLLNMCYWIMRIRGNGAAVTETMDMNDRMKRPLPFSEIEKICNTAQEYGFKAMDNWENYKAECEGFPDAGLNWTSINLYHKFGVEDNEQPYLKTIGKPLSKTKPWGIPSPDRNFSK